MTLDDKSIDLHRQLGGKLEIKSKISLTSREDLSLAYTPGVAAVSRSIADNPDLASELTLKKNTVAIVSDGSAVLGLGNIGAKGAIPVMEGKAILLKEFAGVDAFPLCLDTQDNEAIITAVRQLAPVFGAINLEDITAPRCFEIERRLRSELDIPVMHDDQHGTAIVVLAGLINAIKLRGLTTQDTRIVVNGAGAAGIAITKMLLNFGFKQIILADSQGAIYQGRENLNSEKTEIAVLTNSQKQPGALNDVLKDAHVFIGVSRAGLLTGEMVKSMAADPIIFAMANPIPEIMPDEARSAGAFIVATGRSDFPNQVNNVLAFPGLFRGALDNKIMQFTDEMFVNAAIKLAEYVSEPTTDRILPDPLDKGIAAIIASVVK